MRRSAVHSDDHVVAVDLWAEHAMEKDAAVADDGAGAVPQLRGAGREAPQEPWGELVHPDAPRACECRRRAKAVRAVGLLLPPPQRVAQVRSDTGGGVAWITVHVELTRVQQEVCAAQVEPARAPARVAHPWEEEELLAAAAALPGRRGPGKLDTQRGRRPRLLARRRGWRVPARPGGGSLGARPLAPGCPGQEQEPSHSGSRKDGCNDGKLPWGKTVSAVCPFCRHRLLQVQVGLQLKWASSF
mmetsp:Transcript_7958/g.19025  ORF Transcript_7958/g.19025 Transcript_7958/m.19025 type:complete len:244 (-) Transcript_7958:483-1214(-)